MHNQNSTKTDSVRPAKAKSLRKHRPPWQNSSFFLPTLLNFLEILKQKFKLLMIQSFYSMLISRFFIEINESFEKMSAAEFSFFDGGVVVKERRSLRHLLEESSKSVKSVDLSFISIFDNMMVQNIDRFIYFLPIFNGFPWKSIEFQAKTSLHTKIWRNTSIVMHQIDNFDSFWSLTARIFGGKFKNDFGKKRKRLQFPVILIGSRYFCLPSYIGLILQAQSTMQWWS